jgi:hypothetical protein
MEPRNGRQTAIDSRITASIHQLSALAGAALRASREAQQNSHGWYSPFWLIVDIVIRHLAEVEDVMPRGSGVRDDDGRRATTEDRGANAE